MGFGNGLELVRDILRRILHVGGRNSFCPELSALYGYDVCLPFFAPQQRIKRMTIVNASNNVHDEEIIVVGHAGGDVWQQCVYADLHFYPLSSLLHGHFVWVEFVKPL